MNLGRRVGECSVAFTGVFNCCWVREKECVTVIDKNEVFVKVFVDMMVDLPGVGAGVPGRVW